LLRNSVQPSDGINALQCLFFKKRFQNIQRNLKLYSALKLIVSMKVKLFQLTSERVDMIITGTQNNTDTSDK